MTCAALAVAVWLGAASALVAEDEAPISVDLSGFRPESGIRVRQDGPGLVIVWPMEGEEWGRLALDLRPGRPLIESLAIADGPEAPAATLLAGAAPVTTVTVGTRAAPAGRPPGMSVFNVFFDAPAERPHETFAAALDPRRARVASEGRRATIALGDLSAGPFRGELRLTVYAGAGLVHVESALSTDRDRVAYLYDTGLSGGARGRGHLAWIDTEGRIQKTNSAEDSRGLASIPVRHRAIVAEGESGSVACFPPPHQFFFPRDLTDNLGSVWFGEGHRGLIGPFAFGIRQAEEGGGRFVPWFNAPPGTEQRLGVFYLLARGGAEEALREVERYTHGDRFPELPGYRTFTSHWHMALAIAALRDRAAGREPRAPDALKIFQEMGVNIVHLAEFHGDGHPQDPGPVRLDELAALLDVCRRNSDDRLLFLPGEEANVYLGPDRPGANPGHWLYLFPRPVAWIMRRGEGEPFVRDDARFGTVYRVGDREDMIRLLEREHGLAWTAHPRIKASSWAPDVYRTSAFYRSPTWLGAAWKAMPADLSRPRLGERALDLFSDMDNWGERKYVLGEVDVFQIDPTHELYGHMNVNYLRLDRLPGYDDDWSPILDALRGGRFFVTTGEVLIRSFTIGGKASGETLTTGTGDRPEVRAEVEWTFPLRFAELISGDGQQIYRDRLDLADTGPFGRRTLTMTPDLAGRRWARLEVWDVATDGAFTQPVWIAPGAR